MRTIIVACVEAEQHAFEKVFFLTPFNFSEKSEKRFSGLLASGGRDKKEIESGFNTMGIYIFVHCSVFF